MEADRISSWLRSLVGATPARRPASRSLQDGERIYAVGDIHGRSDLLDAMHALIRADLAERPIEKAGIVYLGDYVDRGPDSFGVLERLAVPPPDLPPATHLMGNHEMALLQFLAGEIDVETLRNFGAFATIRSYGIEPASFGVRREGLQAMRAALLERMPSNHRALLAGLALSLDRHPYFFCHAGVELGVAVDRQQPMTLLWVRDAFLDSDADFGRIVVHGHTPLAAPQVRHNRVSLDTGAFATGRLTAAALERGTVRLLQTGAASACPDRVKPRGRKDSRQH